MQDAVNTLTDPTKRMWYDVELHKKAQLERITGNRGRVKPAAAQPGLGAAAGARPPPNMNGGASSNSGVHHAPPPPTASCGTAPYVAYPNLLLAGTSVCQILCPGCTGVYQLVVANAGATRVLCPVTCPLCKTVSNILQPTAPAPAPRPAGEAGGATWSSKGNAYEEAAAAQAAGKAKGATGSAAVDVGKVRRPSLVLPCPSLVLP